MKTAILPCNGLDKAHGALAREVALRLAEESGNELICPVLWNQAPDRYAQSLDALPLLVIDGCATRCASKLATRLERKIGDRILIADDIKRTGVVLGPSLILDETARQLAHRLASDWLARCAEAPTAPADITSAVEFPAPSEFLEVTHDKFVFQIPAQGFVFNENDVWAQVRGSRARIGISDFAQQQLSDINHCQPPRSGPRSRSSARSAPSRAARPRSRSSRPSRAASWPPIPRWPEHPRRSTRTPTATAGSWKSRCGTSITTGTCSSAARSMPNW